MDKLRRWNRQEIFDIAWSVKSFTCLNMARLFLISKWTSFDTINRRTFSHFPQIRSRSFNKILQQEDCVLRCVGGFVWCGVRRLLLDNRLAWRCEMRVSSPTMYCGSVQSDVCVLWSRSFPRRKRSRLCCAWSVCPPQSRNCLIESRRDCAPCLQLK